MSYSQRRRLPRFPATRIWSSVMTMCGGLLFAGAQAENLPVALRFNPAMLRTPIDTTAFALGTPVRPGVIETDMYVNKVWKGRTQLELQVPHQRFDDGAAMSGHQAGDAVPCFDADLMQTLGFDPRSYVLAKDAVHCDALSNLVEGAKATFDSSSFTLHVTTPQATLKKATRGNVDPSQWDRGITAATLMYDYNAFSVKSDNRTHNSNYLSLRGGFNYEDWRLRLNGAAVWGTGTGFKYHHSQTYAERSLVDWRSRLTIGDTVTDGQVLDSVAFRGVRLASDVRMSPDSARGFAPIIRGIANGNARVRVMQRGIPIYEINVPAGPFVIDDLYPTGSGGDLQVIVTEADGSERSFTVPFSSMVELLRPGTSRYELTLGRYRNPVSSYKPWLFEGTWRRGLSNSLTAYTGAIIAEGYTALAVGTAMNTPVGAVSMDVTHANADLKASAHKSGKALRLNYSRTLPVTDTQVSLSWNRYSSHGFYTASEAFMMRGNNSGVGYPGWLFDLPRKNRMQVSVSQALPGEWGTVALTAWTQNYWGSGKSDNEYQLSYGRQFGRVSVGFNVGRVRRPEIGRTETRGMLTVSVPLGASNSSANTPNYRAGFVGAGDSVSFDQSLSGTVGSAQQVSYNAFTSTSKSRHAGASSSTVWGASGTWASPVASVRGSFSRSGDFTQYGAGVSGGLVAYGDGIILAPTLGDTSAILVAEGARGARVFSYNGLKLNDSGRAVAPYLSAFRMNKVEIDAKDISTDVEIKTTQRHVAPTAGAVVLVKFDTKIGHSLLLRGVRDDGTALPFGASLTDGEGNAVGYVGQGGKALVRVPQQNGALTAVWGTNAAERCVLDYELPPESERDVKGYRRAEVVCHKTHQETK